MNLFDINRQIMNCIKMADGGYVDTETGEIIDTKAIEALEMERDTKIRNIACWIRNLDAEEKALSEQEKIYKDRKTAVKNKKESLKGYLSSVLNGEKWKNNEVVISWRASKVVELSEKLDVTKLPKQYVNYDPKVNKALLKKDIEAGLEIDGVRLVEKNNIQIK